MMREDVSGIKVVEDMTPLDESFLERVDQLVHERLKSRCKYYRNDFGHTVN